MRVGLTITRNTATFDNRRRAVNGDNSVAPSLARRERKGEKRRKLETLVRREKERDGEGGREGEREREREKAREYFSGRATPCTDSRRPVLYATTCAAPSPPGNRRPSSGGGGTAVSFLDAAARFARGACGIPLSPRPREDGAQEGDRLTRRYNGNTRNSGSRSPVTDRSRLISLRLRLALPLSRSRSRSLARSLATHHRIRRTAVCRVSAHIPGGEAVHSRAGVKPAGRRRSFAEWRGGRRSTWATSPETARPTDRSRVRTYEHSRIDLTRGHRKWRCTVARSGSGSSNTAFACSARSHSLASSLRRRTAGAAAQPPPDTARRRRARPADARKIRIHSVPSPEEKLTLENDTFIFESRRVLCL